MSTTSRLPPQLVTKPRRHIVTDESRSAVVEMLARGDNCISIARKLRCAPATLRRFYRKEMTAAGRGGVAHVPTREMRQAIGAMVLTGVPQLRIANALHIKVDTLKKHYSRELDESMDKANTAVVSNLYKIATSRTPQAMPAAIFWAKCKLGWKETSKVEATVDGAGGLIVFSGCLLEHDKTV
jgi:DNA invertase Pin-like site-specific DNA recombinase